MDTASTYSLKSLQQQMLRIVQRFSQLSVFEFKTAMLALAWISAAAVFIALLLFTMWLTALGFLWFFLADHFLNIKIILSLFFGIHFLLVIVMIAIIRHYSKKLLFPKTQQALDLFINK